MTERDRLKRVRTIRMNRVFEVPDKNEASDRLNKIESWAKIVSALAIPVILAIVGWRVQSSVTSEGIKKDYVSMAVTILKDDKVTDPDLKKWAMLIVEKNSPEPLSKKLQSKIMLGALQSTANITIVNPPKNLMVPPLVARAIPIDKIKSGNISEREVFNGWVDTYEVAIKNENSLRFLQEWVLLTQKFEQDIRKIQIDNAVSETVDEVKVEAKK